MHERRHSTASTFHINASQFNALTTTIGQGSDRHPVIAEQTSVKSNGQPTGFDNFHFAESSRSYSQYDPESQRTISECQVDPQSRLLTCDTSSGDYIYGCPALDNNQGHVPAHLAIGPSGAGDANGCVPVAVKAVPLNA